MVPWTSRTTSQHLNAVPTHCNRRTFLKGATLVVAGVSAAVPLQALRTRPATAAQLPYSPDYGPLVPTLDATTGLELLALPEGFKYISYGWAGDPMRDGTPTPGAHDGMAVVAAERHHVVLVWIGVPQPLFPYAPPLRPSPPARRPRAARP